MSNLIERARLTEDEQHQAVFAGPITENMTWNEASVQRVADTQLRKALLTVLEWLDEHRLIADEASADCARLFEELHPHVSSRGRYREAFRA